MSVLADLFGRSKVKASGPRGDVDDFWFNSVSSSTGTGMIVTPDSAARLTAVMACVGLIAETLAAMPLMIYRRRSDGGKDRAPEHPLYELLHDQPNDWQTAFEFKEMQTGALALRGNAYAQIVPGSRGAVDSLVPLHPDRVTVKRLASGRLAYIVRVADGSDQVLTQDEIFHLRLRSNDGITGLSPIAEARETIALAMAAEQHASRFFRNFGSPPGAITTPMELTDEQIDLMRRKWREAHTGDRSGSVAILSNGFAWSSLGVNNKDSQFLEIRQYETIDIARIYRVPPHMIGETTASTSWGSGLEQLSLGFVSYTLQPWLSRWTGAVRRDLITDKDIFFAEFEPAALLRGDRKARLDGYRVEREIGTISVNEIRVKENRNPIEGGDDFTPLSVQRQDPKGGGSMFVGDGAQAQSAMVEGIADRIAASEERALARAPKSDKTWAAWASGFMERQIDHSTKAIAPLAKIDRWSDNDAGALARTILSDAEPEIRPGMDAIGWSARRSPQIASRIMEAGQ